MATQNEEQNGSLNSVIVGFEDEEARKAMEISLEIMDESMKNELNGDDVSNSKEINSKIAENMKQNEQIENNAQTVEEVKEGLKNQKVAGNDDYKEQTNDNDDNENNDDVKVCENEPTDDEIIGFNAKKLKEYITQNSSTHIEIVFGIDKDELRFMALDSKPCGWTKERLINLRRMKLQIRQYLAKKIKSSQKYENIKNLELKLSLFIEQESSKKIDEVIDEIIDEFVVTLKQIKEQESIHEISAHSNEALQADNVNDNNEDVDDEKEQRRMQRDYQHNDELSSVSTHSSMPSLMSDDESDDDFDDDLDDSSDAQKLSGSDNETKGNMVDYNSSDEETANQKKRDITKGYKINKKNDNFVSNDKKNNKKEMKSLSEENVETWLLSSGLSASTCTKLITNGYDTMDLFAACCQDDIDSICTEFNLSIEERERLKAAINKLLKENQMNEL